MKTQIKTKQDAIEQEKRFRAEFPKVDLKPYADELLKRLQTGEDIFFACREMADRILKPMDVSPVMYIPSQLELNENTFYADEVRYAIVRKMVDNF